MESFALPASLQSRAQHVAAAIGQRSGVRVDAAELLTGRAALLGLKPPTRVSSGGASRLLAAADGWVALTLSRDEDVEAVPALVELPCAADNPWDAVAAAAATASAQEFVARARLLDMPAAVLGEVAPSDPKVQLHNEPAEASLADLLVVDMSSMWAGPLCGRILAAAGATVIKVEAPNRPDGTRAGEPRFFDWMNAGKLCYTGDFARLLRAADVVIEASRPAALARRGLGAEQVPARPGRVWVGISGYGRAYPDRVAFGDDAAVAGGLVVHGEDGPVFCGDAVADPLAGVEAALAVLDALAAGGGTIIHVSMAGVAATYAALPDEGTVDCVPRLPELPVQPAHEIGADNARVWEMVQARRVAC